MSSASSSNEYRRVMRGTSTAPVTSTIALTMPGAALQAGSLIAFGAYLSVSIATISDGIVDVIGVQNGVLVGWPFDD